MSPSTEPEVLTKVAAGVAAGVATTRRTGVAAGVATITLNRPAALNALTIPMKEHLLGALETAAADRSVRAIVLTGAGRAPGAAGATYGTVYGMEKTTVYLPSELKRALERAAQYEGRSEADLIREGVAVVTARHEAPEPTAPLFDSGDPDFVSRIDELMEGFGEQ